MADSNGSAGGIPASEVPCASASGVSGQQRNPVTAARLKEKGKKLASAHIHRELAVIGHSDSLHRLLDDLLSPERLISNSESIEWCRWLVAGGRTPAEFASIVRAYDNHAKCGLVWIPHVVAYRCRTCGISPCMSICRDCFKRGNHENHDFNMFLSQAGGACDCGDTSVMKAEGFCSDHGINNCQNKSPVPDDLMLVAEAMMPRLILRMLLHFREFSAINHDSADCRRTAECCNDYCGMLMEFNNMGELMRRVMTKTLIDRGVYRRLLEPPYPSTSYGEYLRESWRWYNEALRKFPSPEAPHDYRHLTALGRTIVHETLLEEFIFWTFKYEFQQQIVCFLLNMLPDQDYKEHLTRTFVMHYCRIPSVLELSNDPDTLSNRVVHMSVQLFSNESLALKMVEELSLLHVMIISLRQMMSKILTPHTLHNPVRNFHYVVDCAERVMKEHCYWPLVSDFNNVLSHESVALVFLKADDLIDMWFQFLSMLQGMNVNIREIISHVEYESSSYYAAFSCELEASAYPMWSIISHLRDALHAPLAKKIMLYCVNYLQDWLDAINFHHHHPKLETYEMSRASFHFPLHRYLAAFICQGVKTMGMTLNDILPSADLLPMLMMHPLRVQSLFYEILSGVWVRNGLQIKGQAMTYIQANFCNSMVDMDLFFLQICATQLPPNHFLGECISIFGVEDWLGMSLVSAAPEMEQDSMLEGLLTFLATLITSRINLGNDETTQCIIEISALLATGDKTHSQLLELMPERSGNAHTRNFERYLRELSIYRSPPVGSENLEQGLFMPMPAVWEQYYDPLHVLLRAVHRRDFQNSLDRFGAYVKQAGKMPRSGNLWPPFRMPDTCGSAYSDPGAVLSSRILHATILVIFYRAVHTHSVSEHMLALAVFLLEMAVSAASVAGGEATTSRSTVGDGAAHGTGTVRADGVSIEAEASTYTGAEATGGHIREAAVADLRNCYPSNCLSDNLRMQVNRISLLPTTRRSPVSYHKPLDGGSSPPFDSDVEWDLSEDETLMMIGSSADTVEGTEGGVVGMAESTTARASGSLNIENSASGVRSSSLVPSSRTSIELVPLSLDLALLPPRAVTHVPPLPSSTSSQMVVEEENEEEGNGTDYEEGDEEDADNDREPHSGDTNGNQTMEELSRRRMWMIRYRRRQQEAQVQESQDEDMLYHVMDEDDDVMVEAVALSNEEHQHIPAARPRDTHRTYHHQAVQMMEEENQGQRNSTDNANVIQEADVEEYINEDDDEDVDEEDEDEVELENEGYVEVEQASDERDQNDSNDEEANMTAVIQSIVPRVSEVPRRGLSTSRQTLADPIGHANTTRQQHHHHRAAANATLLNNRYRHQHLQPGQTMINTDVESSLISRSGQFSVEQQIGSNETTVDASESSHIVAASTTELTVRHEFVSVSRDANYFDEEEGDNHVQEGLDGSASRMRTRQRQQEIAIPVRSLTSPANVSRAAVGGLLLPLNRVQAMATNVSRPISETGPEHDSLSVVNQQTQLQNYYPAGNHHHHLHHHHPRHHHHNYNAEGTSRNVAPAQQVTQQPLQHQQLNPQSLQQQTPRHFRSLQGGTGQLNAGSAESGGQHHSQQGPLWMRFRRRNLANSRQRSSASSATGMARANPVSAFTVAANVELHNIGSEMAPRDSAGERDAINNSGDRGTGAGGSQTANTMSNTVVLEESIISLLLKLHSQLSGALDSFSLEDEDELPPATVSAAGSRQHNPSTCSADGGINGNASNQNHSQMMELDEEQPVPRSSGGFSNIESSSQQTSKPQVTSNPVPPARSSESRIGDGPYFIGNLLRKIATLDDNCAARIDEIRKQLWPNQRERQAEQKAREAREKEERSKRAKERQKKMMEEFANRQKRFMQMAMAAMGGGSESDPSVMDGCFGDDADEDAERRHEEQAHRQAEAEALQLREKEYTCIICNTSGPSTESNPIGLVVLVESTSVVGHRRARSDRLALPLSPEDRTALEQSVTLAGEFGRRIELLQWKFGPTSWFLSHNIGWEGGVHIQSCGHHVHLSCQDAYLRSLHTPRSPNNLNVELGEFFCPVCRQLANSVLPLSPSLDRPAPLIRSPTPPHRTLVLELIGLFQESKRTPMASKFSEAMGRAMGNITACTQRNIKRYPVTLQSLFSFVISIARTNLEAEIIQRGGSLCTGGTDDVRYKLKRDCIVPLLHVLSLHVRLMINDDWPIRFKVGDDWPWHSWSRLAGIQLTYDASGAVNDDGKSKTNPASHGVSSFVDSHPTNFDVQKNVIDSHSNDVVESDLAMAVVPSTGSSSRGRRRSNEDDSDDDDDDEDDEDGVLCRLRRVATSIRGMLLPPPRSSSDEPQADTANISINRRMASGTAVPGESDVTDATGTPGTIATSSITTAAATAANMVVDTETIPDLISDPTALMLKFILLAPLHLDQAYFTCIVKVMYNLLYYQIVLQLCTHLTDEECDEILTRYNQELPRRIVKERGVPHIGVAMAFVLGQLDCCRHIRSDSILMGTGSSLSSSNDTAVCTDASCGSNRNNSASAMELGNGSNTPATSKRPERVNLLVLEKKLQRLCLPFLRVAALLRHHIYHAEIPDIAGPHLEFARLVYFLELVTVSLDWDKFNASKALCFLPGTELTLPKNWCDQLRNLRPTYESTRSLIVKQHIEWLQPRLLGLPREYERLFTYYHEQPCQKCKNVPKESSICLLCGTIVCIKQTCCKEQDCCEAVRHSITCGGGTGIFLVITSTYIIVIRGHRACLWGSLYLDDYDEEDRDLKRGKPLYLSEDRFNLLESQWLSHRFAHTKHNWVWHRDSL